MSTELAQQSEIFKARGIEVIEHKHGNFVIVNTELITPKTVGIITHSLNEFGFGELGHGLFSVVFRDDGYPVDRDGTLNSWIFNPDAHSAICNIEHCIELAIQDTQNPEIEHSEKASVHMGVWKNMIKGFLHEAFHSVGFLSDPKAMRFDKKTRDLDEKEAPEFARTALEDLAKSIDIEPEFSPAVQNMIDERLALEIGMIDETKDAEKHLKAWAFFQKYLLEHGGVFYVPSEEKGEDPLHLMKFKHYLHFFSEDAEDDPDWAADTIGVGATLVATPLNEQSNGQPAVIDMVEGETYVVEDNDDMVAEYDVPWEEGAPTGFQGVPQFQNNQSEPQPAPQLPAMHRPAQQPTPQAPVTQQTTTPVAPQATPVAPQMGQPMAPVAQQTAQAKYPAVQLNGDPQAIVNNFYLKIFANVFQGCMYNPTHPQMPFGGAGNIVNWLPLDENETKLVKEMMCYSPEGNGNKVKMAVQGQISGILMDKAGTLPGYELTMQTPDGHEVRRKFIPQNPNKLKNGQPTGPAQQAKAGNQIMWVVEPNEGAIADKYLFKITNSVIEKLNG